MTNDKWTYKEGDSAGGYWAQILREDTVVATVYEPDLAPLLVELLNNRAKGGP